jgi:hypothetical protein
VLTAATAAGNTMTDLAAKADAGRDVVRVSETEAQSYRLRDRELTDSNAIGDSDGFPQYGEFLDVEAVDANGDGLGPRWVECPADLARCLVDSGVETGDVFAVVRSTKTTDGAWSIEIEVDG